MRISARFRRHAPLLIQCALVVVGLLALYVTPPVSGQMLLLPVGPGSRAVLVASRCIARMQMASVSSAGSRSSQALSVSCSSKPWRSRQRPTRWLIN